jgi:signal transduction histidine kinase
MEAMAEVKDKVRLLRIETRDTDKGHVEIRIEDSGAGVDPAKLPQIYDAFFTTKREGMGMGLAICRSIVEMHGGRLWATPRLPNGSVFSFTVSTSVGSLE